MDIIPPELWSQIFWHACVDTGYTGCSISLTCRLFNDVGKSTKFRSVALHGLHRAIAFLTVIKSLPSQYTRVENIYIYLNNLSEDVDMMFRGGLPNVLVAENCDDQIESNQSIEMRVIALVLNAVAPNLRYLYLSLNVSRGEAVIPLIHLPQLYELVLRGQYDDCDDSPIEIFFPLINLRRLWMFGVHTGIARYAPYLTNLCIDHNKPYSEPLWWSIKKILGSKPADSPDEPKKFPTSLERLLIHPGPRYVSWYASTGTWEVTLEHALHTLVKSDPRLFLYANSPPRSTDKFTDGLTEWLDRINGKLAYWEVKDVAEDL